MLHLIIFFPQYLHTLVTVLDDLVLTPLITYYRSKLIANKSIDERLGEDGDIESKSTTTEQN